MVWNDVKVVVWTDIKHIKREGGSSHSCYIPLSEVRPGTLPCLGTEKKEYMHHNQQEQNTQLQKN